MKRFLQYITPGAQLGKGYQNNLMNYIELRVFSEGGLNPSLDAS